MKAALTGRAVPKTSSHRKQVLAQRKPVAKTSTKSRVTANCTDFLTTQRTNILKANKSGTKSGTRSKPNYQSLVLRCKSPSQGDLFKSLEEKSQKSPPPSCSQAINLFSSFSSDQSLQILSVACEPVLHTRQQVAASCIQRAWRKYKRLKNLDFYCAAIARITAQDSPLRTDSGGMRLTNFDAKSSVKSFRLETASPGHRPKKAWQTNQQLKQMRSFWINFTEVINESLILQDQYNEIEQAQAVARLFHSKLANLCRKQLDLPKEPAQFSRKVLANSLSAFHDRYRTIVAVIKDKKQSGVPTAELETWAVKQLTQLIEGRVQLAEGSKIAHQMVLRGERDKAWLEGQLSRCLSEQRLSKRQLNGLHFLEIPGEVLVAAVQELIRAEENQFKSLGQCVNYQLEEQPLQRNQGLRQGLIEQTLYRLVQYLQANKQLFSSKLSMPLPPEPLDVLRYLRVYYEDVLSDSNEGDSLLTQDLIYQLCYDSSDAAAQFKRAVIDAFNQAADLQRPYGIRGKPFPWIPHPISTPKYSHADFSKKLASCSKQVAGWARKSIGVLSQQSEAREQSMYREAMDLQEWLLEQQPGLACSDDERTEVLMVLSLGVGEWLLEDEAEGLSALIKQN